MRRYAGGATRGGFAVDEVMLVTGGTRKAGNAVGQAEHVAKASPWATATRDRRRLLQAAPGSAHATGGRAGGERGRGERGGARAGAGHRFGLARARGWAA